MDETTKHHPQLVEKNWTSMEEGVRQHVEQYCYGTGHDPIKYVQE